MDENGDEYSLYHGRAPVMKVITFEGSWRARGLIAIGGHQLNHATLNALPKHSLIHRPCVFFASLPNILGKTLLNSSENTDMYCLLVRSTTRVESDRKYAFDAN